MRRPHMPFAYHKQRGIEMHRRAQSAEGRLERAASDRDFWRRFAIRNLGKHVVLQPVWERSRPLDRIISIGRLYP